MDVIDVLGGGGPYQKHGPSMTGLHATLVIVVIKAKAKRPHQ